MNHESSMTLTNPTLMNFQMLTWALTDTAPSLLICSLSLFTMSWLAGDKNIKEEAHFSSSVFAAFHGYQNSAQNMSAHHHGGNCNIKPRTVKSQNTRHIQVLESEQETIHTSEKHKSLQVLLKQFRFLSRFVPFQI